MPKAKPKPAAKPWPDRVRALLARYDLTQAELGLRLGVTQATVGRYVDGWRPVPGPIRRLTTMMEDGDDLARFEEI